MSGEPPPAPESCLHNLHRAGEGRTPRPEPSDLCSNALGVFHMADCPLQIGQSCAYYEVAPVQHETTSDADLGARRDELHDDFLTWRYRRRVRALMKPKGLAP